MKKTTKKDSSKKKDRIILNEFDLDELKTLAAKKDIHDLPLYYRAINRFIRLQKRRRPEDLQIIHNLFKAYGPCCDITGHNLTPHHYDDVISTGQLILLYVSDAEDLRSQCLAQLSKRQGGLEQMQLL